MERAVTPPPQPLLPGANVGLTPDAQRRLQENRLKAKARYRATPSTSDVVNTFNKRPLVIPDPAVATRPTSGGGGGPVALPNMIGKFVDYDLSTLKNSKGGFLLDEEEDDARILKERQRMTDLKRKRDLQTSKQQDPHLSILPGLNPQCKLCGTVELDFQLHKIFKVSVCVKCKNDNPDRFSLLTKTECKEDYLLTDPELKDSELLPHLLRPNPHRSTYSNMMLFLREQVEEFAFSHQKWGSAQALDEEFERRDVEKKKKKSKKFEDKLKELRKKTRSNVYHQRKEAEHVHEFEQQDDEQVQRCSGCGLEVECEQF